MSKEDIAQIEKDSIEQSKATNFFIDRAGAYRDWCFTELIGIPFEPRIAIPVADSNHLLPRTE